jgi:hypothetical protein
MKEKRRYQNKQRKKEKRRQQKSLTFDTTIVPKVTLFKKFEKIWKYSIFEN